MEYLALFPAGTASLVADGLQSLLAGADVLESDDSALSFATQVRLDSSDAVPIARNLFRVRGRAARRDLDGTAAQLAKMVRDLPRPRDCTGFRVMFHVDGRLVASSPRARMTIEDAIIAATGLRPEPRGSCREYWVIGRRDWPAMYLAERLPASTARRSAPRGSLSRELAALLVSLSHPDPQDVFLDPFAGHGAIVSARLATPARKVIFNDRDTSLCDSVAARLGKHAGLVFSGEDGTSMTSVKSADVSAIVTDPPWGEYDESIGDYAQFTRSMAAEFCRLLDSQRGRLVLLVSRRGAEQVQQSLIEVGFGWEPPIGILVNGHPASVIRGLPRRG